MPTGLFISTCFQALAGKRAAIEADMQAAETLGLPVFFTETLAVDVEAGTPCTVITDKKNHRLELYDAARVNPIKNIKPLIKENINMARQLIKGLVSNHPGEIVQLGQDTATEIKRDDSSTGVYKSDEGKVYAVDLTCTHMGCKAN